MMLTQNQKDTVELQRNRLSTAVDIPKIFGDTALEPWVTRVKNPTRDNNSNGSGGSKPIITPPVTAISRDSKGRVVGSSVVDTVDLSVGRDEITNLKYYSDLDSFIRDYSIRLAADDPIDASYLNGGNITSSSNAGMGMDSFGAGGNIFIFNLVPLTALGTSANHSKTFGKLAFLLSPSDKSYSFREITDTSNPSRKLYFLKLKLSSACIRTPKMFTLENLLETSSVDSEVSVGDIVQAINMSKHLVVFDRYSTLGRCSKDTYLFLKRLHQDTFTGGGIEGRDIVLLSASGPQSSISSISTSGPVSKCLPIASNRSNIRTRSGGFNKGSTVGKRRFNLKISIPKESNSTTNIFLNSLKKDSVTYSPSSLKKYFKFKIPDGIELNDKSLPVWLRDYTDRNKTDEVLVHLMHKFELLESLEMRRLSHCITKFVSGDQYNNSVSLTGSFNGVLTNLKLFTTTDAAIGKESIDLNPSIHQSIYSLPRLQRLYKKKVAMERMADPHLSSIPPTPLSSIGSVSHTPSTSLSPSPLPSSHGQEDTAGIDLHSGIGGSTADDNSLITPFDKYELSQGITSFDKNRYSNILPYEHSRVKLRYSPVNLVPKVNGSSTSVGDVTQNHSPLTPFGGFQHHGNSHLRFANPSFMKSVEGGVQSVPPERTRKSAGSCNGHSISLNPTPESSLSKLASENLLSSKSVAGMDTAPRSNIGHLPMNDSAHTMPAATAPIAMPVPVPASLSFLNSSTTLNSLNSADTKEEGEGEEEEDLKSTSGTPYSITASSSTTVSTTTGDALCSSTYPNEPIQYSDYFNANYLSIPDINPDYTYIATQAPLPSTIDDFWRVVTSNNIKVIVSLNSDDELRLRKWNVYWTNTPDNGHMSAYRINLIETIEDIDNLLGCTLRIFQVLRNRSSQTISLSGDSSPFPRETAFSLVYQLQYSRWSDSMPTNMRDLLHLFQIKDQLVKAPVAYLSGLVNNPLSAVSLLKISKLQSCCRNFNRIVAPDSPNSKDIPSLVHCSAGCGRTGVFITLDFLINLLTNEDTKEDNRIDVWNMKQDLIFIIVNEFRKQRLSMVQNLSQFISCYESMLQFFEIMKE